MTEYKQEQIDEWETSISRFHMSTVQSEDERSAREAAANLCSGYGLTALNMPEAIMRAFNQAIEIGYAAALKDVRDGEFDDDIEYWRNELFDA